MSFVKQFRRECLHPECSRAVRDFFGDILFAKDLTVRQRVERLQEALDSPPPQRPDFTFLGPFLSAWDTRRISDAVDTEVDDDSIVMPRLGETPKSLPSGKGPKPLSSDKGPKLLPLGKGPKPLPSGKGPRSFPQGKGPRQLAWGQDTISRAVDPYDLAGWAPKEDAAKTHPRATPDSELMDVDDMEDVDLVRPQTSDPGVGAPLRPDQGDCQDDHVFKGQLQPPVGIRLKHVLNFLADEDRHRCLDWDSHIHEIREYLDFLDGGETTDPAVNLGPKTLQLLDEAKRRVLAHDIYDEHCDDRTVHIPASRDSVPRPEPRLAVPGASPPITLGQEKAAPVLLPRRVLHRAPAAVNDMLQHYPDAEAHLARLVRDEDDLWRTPVGDAGAVPATNLSRAENAEYEADMAAGRGWVSVAVESGGVSRRRLPDGTALSNDAKSFARERGARRAGLQQCLRYFGGIETALAQTPAMRVVLPVPATALSQAADDAAGTRFYPLMMRRSDLPTALETHPYTIHMAEYRRVRTWWLAQARTRVEKAHEGDSDWIRLPRCHDAFVLRPFEARVQEKQDLLHLMHAVKPTDGSYGLLARALAVAPRPLLQDVKFWMDQGSRADRPPKKARAPSGEAGPTFRDKFDWEVPGRTVKMVNATEVRWLAWLLTGSCNRGMAQDLPLEKAALFLAFAERLQRLMDETHEACLFKDLETKVSVEHLLNVMNSTADGSENNTKAKFGVYDAIYWLNRLSNFGRCRCVAIISHSA